VLHKVLQQADRAVAYLDLAGHALLKGYQYKSDQALLGTLRQAVRAAWTGTAESTAALGLHYRADTTAATGLLWRWAKELRFQHTVEHWRTGVRATRDLHGGCQDYIALLVQAGQLADQHTPVLDPDLRQPLAHQALP